MSHHRAPLSNIPNAANSPFRAVAAAASKRSRLDAGLQEDVHNDRYPPAKRQALDYKASNIRTPPQRQPLKSGDDGPFNKRTQNRKPTAFERKLLAAKEGQNLEKSEKQDKATGEDGIRSWQKHYRRLFPGFVFFFESIPDDVRLRCSRQIKALGASEEKFFSKDVTHVVTARPVPIGSDTSPTEGDSSSSKILSSQATQPRTINPSLLDKHAEPTTQSNNIKLSLENAVGRKAKGPIRLFADAEPKKASAGNTDVLQRAHGMGIKIWQLEKLIRVIESMNGGVADSQSHPGRNARNTSHIAGGKASREADLSRLLRNEQLNGPSDRDHTVASEELVPFRGYYIYIYDMDERTKPILVKEYAKVNRNEDGDWPQFRANASGKCPFVEDPYAARQEYERAKQQAKEERARAQPQNQAPSKTRAGTALLKKNAEIDAEVSQRRPLTESRNAGNRSTAVTQQLPPQEFCPPPPPVNTKSPSKLFKAAPVTGTTRFFGGEPAASGLQQSNVTSAIRSQMISSTAAAPGAKAGTSREVHGLKRKVLERNAPALHGMHTTQRPPVPPGPARAEQAIPVTRQSRRRAQERLVHIEEESTQSEEEDVWQAEAQRVSAVASKAIKTKDPKPGYCENCRERYDDFDNHIAGRKHRKFALARDHWKDLDSLLSQLGRPLKEQKPEDPEIYEDVEEEDVEEEEEEEAGF